MQNSNKILTKGIQQPKKTVIHHNEVEFIPGMFQHNMYQAICSHMDRPRDYHIK